MYGPNVAKLRMRLAQAEYCYTPCLHKRGRDGSLAGPKTHALRMLGSARSSPWTCRARQRRICSA